MMPWSNMMQKVRGSTSLFSERKQWSLRGEPTHSHAELEKKVDDVLKGFHESKEMQTLMVAEDSTTLSLIHI